MQNVCFVVPRAYEYFFQGIKPSGGGAEKQCYLLAKQCANFSEIKVSFCITDHGQAERFSKDGICLWKVYKPGDNKLVSILKLGRTLRKVDSEIYIFRAANIAHLFLGIYIKKVLKKQVLYMMASDSEIHLSSLRKKSGFLTALFMKIYHKYVNILTVQNNEQYNELKKQRAKKATFIIPNVIDSELNSVFGNDNSKKYVLWVGRLDPIKQPEILIEMASEYKQEKFVLIGPEVPEYKKYGSLLKQKIRTVPNIKYIEFVEANKMLDYYLNAQVFLLTSKKEGFSNTMMEAMLAKCAVLSLNVNPNGIFDNRKNGICANGNKKLFNSCFVKLISNINFSKNIADNARKYILENHDIINISRKFCNILKKCN